MEKEGPIKQQLLIAFLDLLSFEKKVNNWSEEKFSENPPRLYRLKIINALMKALQIKCSYADFLNGEFKKILNLQKSKECNSKISDIDLTMQIIKQDLLEEYDFLD